MPYYTRNLVSGTQATFNLKNKMIAVSVGDFSIAESYLLISHTLRNTKIKISDISVSDTSQRNLQLSFRLVGLSSDKFCNISA